MNIFDFDSLFSDVGSKLQSVARWFYGITLTLLLVGGGIGAIWVLFNADFIIAILVIVGIVLAIGLYILAALISSWYIHGFGTLVQRAETEERPVRQIDYPTDGIYKCESCGHVLNSNKRYCTNCGHVVGSAEKSDAPTKMHWTCTCGMKNAKFTSICISCGKPRPGDGYQKCPSCGAMVRAGESCPLCEK